MTIRVGINGLGRIGRCVARAIYQEKRDDIELVAVNGPAPIETHIHLLKYDSVHGRFPFEVNADGENLRINGKKVILTHTRDPKEITWADMGVDIVLECTGRFNSRDDAAQHLASGVKKVLVSAPASGADATIVYGVNNHDLKKDHEVVSVGSCTTNGLAPLVKTLNDSVGIVSGFMTTVHSYTGDQNIVDGSHKDLRRARAAAMSIIPTTTGAAKTLGLILPEMKGKLDGIALRVPTPNVSLIDLSFTTPNPVSIDDVNNALIAASKGALKGVLGVSDEPLVSTDFTGTTCSSIVDLSGTYVTGGNLVRIGSWYDNEWAFSNRMLDVAKLWL